jgi:co-chaperonin GroES (HSP10)
MTPVQPLGFNCLVKIIPVEAKTKSGIITLSSTDEERERKGRDIAEVVAFGPVAFKGYAGCESAEDWGVKVGDIVELSTRYDGKFTRASEYNEAYKNYRYVNDQDIMGLASGEFLAQIKEGMSNGD